MEREQQIYAHPKTLEFIRAVNNDPNHPIQKVAQKHALEQEKTGSWNIKAHTLKLNIFGAFFFSPATLEEVGKVYGISRERVRQILETTKEDLWRNSSYALKMNFPLNSIPLKKPASLELRERISLIKGGKSVKVAEVLREINEEARTPKEIFKIIKEKTGMTPSDLSDVRVVLKGWRIELPRVHKDRRVLVKRLRESYDDREIEELFKEVSMNFYRRHRDLFATLKEVYTGYLYILNNQVHLLAESLKKAKVPLRIIGHEKKEGLEGYGKYYLVVRQHLDRAREALLNDPKLDKFKKSNVVQICGPEVEKPPSIFNLRTKVGFKSPARLLREMGVDVPLSGLGSRLKEFLTEDCPVPIFKYDTRHHYPAETEEELKAFFLVRIAELKLKPAL